MQLKHLIKLEIYTYQRHLVLCQIHAKPYGISIYQQTPKAHHRWFESDFFWLNFENELHRILDTKLNWNAKDQPFKTNFHINSLIKVSVTNSRQLLESSSYQLSCLDVSVDDVALALVCNVQFIETKTGKEQRQPSSSSLDGYDPPGYRPTLYEPYTPSKKNSDCENNGCETKPSMAASDDRYSPAPVKRAGAANTRTPIPQYKPMLIGPRKAERKKAIEECIEASDEDEVKAKRKRRKFDTVSEKQSEKLTANEVEETQTRQKLRKQGKDKSKQQDNKESTVESSEETEKSRKQSSKGKANKCKSQKEVKDAEKHSDLETEEAVRSKSKKQKEILPTASPSPKSCISGSDDSITHTVRTRRSPMKTMRYLSYEAERINKKRNKNNDEQTMKILFGSDEDEPGPAASETKPKKQNKDIPETPQVKHVTADDIKSESSRKQRKPDGAKPLSIVRKNSTASSSSKDSQSSKSDADPIKRMEMLDMLETILDSIPQAPPPPKVEILLLSDMSGDEVLATFDRYKPELDKIFKKMKHVQRVTSYEGLSHINIINILTNDVQMEMLQKCSDAYNPVTPNTNYTVMFFNCMLPVWVTLLFMDRYKMTRDQAIKQIVAQQKYGDYLKSKSNPSAACL